MSVNVAANAAGVCQFNDECGRRGVAAGHIHAAAFNLAGGRTPRDGRGLWMPWVPIFLVLLWLQASAVAAGLRSCLGPAESQQHHGQQHAH